MTEDTITPVVRALATEAFEALSDKEGWSMNLSCPMPLRWNGSPTPVIWYVYADRMTPGLVGGQEISQPWASIELTEEPDAKPHFIPLSGKLEVLGVQGVRPMGPMKPLPQSAPVWEMLRSGQPSEPLKLKVQFSKKNNGTIFKVLTERHPDFFKWLDAA